MASNVASSDLSDDITVRILASFYLTTDKTVDKTSPSTSGKAVSSGPIHKEKFNVLIREEHKELHKFLSHFKSYTGLKTIARSKGLGENPEITIATVQKAGSGIDAFSLRTQDAWEYDFKKLVKGNGMLQGTSNK